MQPFQHLDIFRLDREDFQKFREKLERVFSTNQLAKTHRLEKFGRCILEKALVMVPKGTSSLDAAMEILNLLPEKQVWRSHQGCKVPSCKVASEPVELDGQSFRNVYVAEEE
jgi:hypothetical protein